MQKSPMIGIVTPTYNRLKFIKKFIKNVKRQSYKHFKLILVHDGPSDEYKALCETLFGNDDRLIYLNTPVAGRDWGVTPRILAIEKLKNLNVDYMVMWDDDNLFHKDALAIIASELVSHRLPKLLLVNLFRGCEIYPCYKDEVSNEIEKIDTGNIVVTRELAETLYSSVKSVCPDLYAQDFYFFKILKENLKKEEIARSKAIPIGLYDGLRSAHYLRHKLKLPSFDFFYRFSIYRKIRAYYRG